MTFYGYKRPDGRVGVRNKVLILPASLCASDTARIISQQVVGTVTFHNQQGCAQVAPDQQLTMDVMAGYAANPNIYGTVVVSLGCENCQMDLVVKAIQERTNKPIKEVIIQEVGGTLKAVDMGVRYAKEMVAEASMLQKEEFPISELIIGTECGGSDPTSGLAANPVIGEMSDRIVAAGGTSILSETTEFIGAEHILARRAATPCMTAFSRSSIATKPLCGWWAKKSGTATPLRATRPAASPRWRKNLWAASTRAATAPSTPSMTTPSRWRASRVWSLWTRRATIPPPWRPWWPAAHRWWSFPAAAARLPATPLPLSSSSPATS